MDNEDVVCTHTRTRNGLLFNNKKEWKLTIIPTQMDLEGIKPSEISQIDKDKFCMLTLVFVI